MDKQQLLNEISLMARQGQLSQAEVLAAFPPSAVTVPEPPSAPAFSLSEIMYYIGGAIVFLGIVVLCYQNWESFSSPLRVLVTLGSMVACFVTAALLHKYENFQKISQAFFLISGMLAPMALEVTFREMSVDLGSNSTQLFIFFLLTAVYLGAFYFFRQTILLFFGIIFATGFFHFIINILVGDNLTYQNSSKIWEYRILTMGLAYMLVGYYLSSTFQKALSGILYAFGSVFFLGAAMSLGGWSPDQNAFWELIYPLLVFGIIFLSVYVKSKSFLVFGSLFLVGYILKLTSEYFSEGLGWPLALVLAGLAIMAVGYYAVRINRKYLASAA